MRKCRVIENCRGCCLITLIALLFSLDAMASRPLRIVFPGAGVDDLMRPEARVRISQATFLTDLLKADGQFRIVSEDRGKAIFTLIGTGARDYGTENLVEIIRHHHLEVDVACDFHPLASKGKNAPDIELAVWTKEGVQKGRVKYDICQASEKLIDLLVKACKLDEATAKRYHGFLRDRARIYSALYVVPRLRGHYCDNTGETQFKWLLGLLSAKDMDLRVNARLCEAAWWAYADGRAVGVGSHDPNWTMARVNRIGLAAINSVIGTAEEDSMRKYVSVKRAPQNISDTLYGYAKILAEDAVGRSMTEALEKVDGDADELDPDHDETKAEKQAQKKEAQARGGLKGLAWRGEKAGLELTLECAKQTESLTRRTVAYCLDFYDDVAQTEPVLRMIAEGKDAIAALYANRALLNHKLAAPGAAASARKVIDGKLFDAGVTGFDPLQVALSVLADTGAVSDRARFEAYASDVKVEYRRVCVRGLFAKCRPTAADLHYLDDTDSSVVVAGLHEFTPALIGSENQFADRARSFANDACQTVADAARVAMGSVRPTSGPELVEYRLAFGNPYERRCVIDGCALEKEVEGVAKGCANADAHIRAYALNALMRIDRTRARVEALKLLNDRHTFTRFYAAKALGEVAEKDDLATLEQALAKEKNRVAKLYLADAVALASGRPKPAPLPQVNSVRATGNAIVWQCFLGSPREDKNLFDGYYTCAEPNLQPSAEIKRVHDERKASIFPRPTPIGCPGRIIAESASMDTFWTVLDKQLPAGCIEYVDGLVYGEESMWYGSDQLWGLLWSTFCEAAKIDANQVRGEKKNLTENQQLAWADWSCRVMVRAVNEMIDFTRDYIGKLRPGIECCTYSGTRCFGETDAYKELKFDLYGTYSYDGDSRGKYAAIRRIKSIFPDKPVQWLSFGNIDIGLGGSCNSKPITWNTKVPTHPISRRFEHCYADSMLVWLGGSDTGYFTNFGASGTGKEKKSSPALNNGNCYAGSPVPGLAADAAVSGAYDFYKDAAKQAKRDASEDIDVPSKGDLDDLELDEEGSANDPIMKQIAARREEIRRGIQYMMRMTRDTTAIALGLKRQFPGHYESFLLGSSCYSPAGMLLPNFDVFSNAREPTELPGLDHFKCAVVSGAKARMDEATRVKWIEWLKRKPTVLVICGGLFSCGIDYPYIDLARPQGDLRTCWPWEKDVLVTPTKKGRSVRYVLGKGTTKAKIVESDKEGATRIVWSDPAFRGFVVFDLTRGREATWSLRKLIADFQQRNSVQFELNEHPGRIGGRAGPLQVEHLSRYSYTTNTSPHGFELLTGKYNPVVTPQFNCAVTTDEYVSPCIAIHGGVYVLAHDTRLKLIEKVPNGVKVEVQGLCHAVTKTGKPAKITGKALREIKTDPNLWFIDNVDEEGICTLAPHGDVECIDRGGEIDDMPPWRIFNVKEPTVLTITCE